MDCKALGPISWEDIECYLTKVEMPSAHYGMDNILCTRRSHLKINLVTEGVELTAQNKLALRQACPDTGGGHHHCSSHMSKLLTGGKSTFHHSTR